jgi:hypothetical protein
MRRIGGQRVAAIAVVAGALLAAVEPAVAANAPTSGTWSGTIKYEASGDWNYTIGYRGDEERRTEATSSHQVSWTVTFDEARGNSEFAEFDFPTADLTQYSWSGTAANAGQGGCNYGASGSLTGSVPGGLIFYGRDANGKPFFRFGLVADGMAFSVSQSDCGPNAIFGFTQPSGFYDDVLLIRGDYTGSSAPVRLSFCPDDAALDKVPAPRTGANGQTVLRDTASGSCNGHEVHWFGDSDVYHDSTRTQKYTYDLVFRPDEGPCQDGIDNDNDGTMDAGGDPGCVSEFDPTEYGNNECDNGRDDDGNQKIDFRSDGSGDPGCESLTDTTERTDCRSASAADRHFTTLDVPARLNVSRYPDPHLGSLHMSIPWCMTPQGPRIMTRADSVSDPFGWWDGTDNWVLLGALEYVGITVDPPAEPVVTHGPVVASVSTSLNANLDASDAILSAIPVGKLFKPLKKSIGKYADDLNPLAKRLKRFHSEVLTATKKMEKSRGQALTARRHVAEVRGWVADAQQELRAAKTRAERDRIERKLADLKKTENAAKKAERVESLQYQRDLRKLRSIKADEAKLARKVDKILKKIRKLDEQVLELKAKVREAIDKRVKGIEPDWAREYVEQWVDDLDRAVTPPIQHVASRVKKLSTNTLLAIVKSGSATSSLVGLLKGTYTETVNKIANVKIPMWDASYLVSFDQAGTPSFADNSQSRFIFTIETEPVLRTTS